MFIKDLRNTTEILTALTRLSTNPNRKLQTDMLKELRKLC